MTESNLVYFTNLEQDADKDRDTFEPKLVLVRRGTLGESSGVPDSIKPAFWS